MNAIAKFWSLGSEDADRRLAAALAPVPSGPADRYLMTSALVIAVDRMTRRLHGWWLASAAGQAWSAVPCALGEPSSARYQRVAGVLLAATAAHLTLTLLNGPRPGWFWILIPAMVATFATLLLAASRSFRSAD